MGPNPVLHRTRLRRAGEVHVGHHNGPMRPLVVLLPFLVAGCTFRLALPAPDRPVPTACALKVIDSRPDPDAMYFKGSGGTGRAVAEPPVSEAIRRTTCAALPAGQLAVPATFVVTDFECSAFGLAEIRYLVDLRGRLERPDRAPVELRSGNMLLTYEGIWPIACENTAKPVVPALAIDLAKAIQGPDVSKP